jgi:endonuclease/exonuclease/phosphatase family metal-dependent hydrolase
MLPVFKGACITAGSLFFCSIAAAADDAPTQVTFAAWNLRNYLHTVGAPAPPAPRDTKPKPPGEVEAVTRILASLHPDIAGICEMGAPEDLAALQQRLKSAGLELPHSEFVQAADTDRRLALLSRYPIVARHSQTQLHYLLDESKLPVQRGILDVTLQVTDNYRLRCIGVHLKSRRDVPEASEGLMRRNEAHLLRQYADSILTADPDTNLLVYGDFNDPRNEPPVRAIMGMRGSASYLTALTPVDDGGQRWTYYFADSDTYSRIDFLLASKGLNPEIDDTNCRIYSGADWFTASDHRAITAVIRPLEKIRRAKKPASPEEKSASSSAAE